MEKEALTELTEPQMKGQHSGFQNNKAEQRLKEQTNETAIPGCGEDVPVTGKGKVKK